MVSDPCRWGLEDIHALLRALCLDPLPPISSPAFSHQALVASGALAPTQTERF